MRDGHRCVISGYFDEKEAARRLRRRLDPKDDDGHPLKDEASRGFEALEVAHILPLSLRTPSPGETDLVCMSDICSTICMTHMITDTSMLTERVQEERVRHTRNV